MSHGAWFRGLGQVGMLGLIFTFLGGASNKPMRIASPYHNGSRREGALIINADDWGRDQETTDRTLECSQAKALSSVSAMVFMEDSERAAVLSREHGVDAGLHLNLTSPFTDPRTPARLQERQQRLISFLRRNSFSRLVFHPGLKEEFAYVAAAQREEFERLYGQAPARVDGHHHMHLCTNVLAQGLLPEGAQVRRNFSFLPGEKSLINRLYRLGVDALLARRYAQTDYFFSLPPLAPPERLRRIFSLAKDFVVEVETHPINPEEHRFLAGGEVFRWLGDVPVAPRFTAKR